MDVRLLLKFELMGVFMIPGVVEVLLLRATVIAQPILICFVLDQVFL